MKKTLNIFPGQQTVSFRKGPSGHLRQDPSDEAMRIKNNPSLQDKSAPQSHQLVRTNALTLVFQRGGDVSDRVEVMGEYLLQFGKYKGKSFKWLLENDVGYTIFLMKKVEEEEREGTFNPQGHAKESLLSFLDYASSFQDIMDLRAYLSSRKPSSPVASEGDNIVGFGARARDTWRKIWETRADGYAAFILGVKCVKNNKMYNLQQYLLSQQRAETCPPPAEVPTTLASSTSLASTTLVMEEDVELEREMRHLSPSKYNIEPRPSAVLPKVTDESQTTGFSPPEWNKSAVLSAHLTIHEFPIGQRVCCFGHVLACSDVCLFISFVVLAMFRPVLMPVFSHEFKEHMCQQRCTKSYGNNCHCVQMWRDG
ncbi:uncharacterized protein [Paralichthys olivaceus]